MVITLRRCVAGVVVSLLLACSHEARADVSSTGVTVAFVGVGFAAVAGITIGIVYVVRHKPSITGCVASHEGGLSLKNESDGQNYVLRGDLASIAAGQRVRVSGRRMKHVDPAEFDVAKVKSMGVCPVT